MHRKRVFENRVLKNIFVSKREEVTGEWRKLRREQLKDLYCSPNIIRVRLAGNVPHMEEERTA